MGDSASHHLPAFFGVFFQSFAFRPLFVNHMPVENAALVFPGDFVINKRMG